MDKELELKVLQKMNELFISYRYLYIYQFKNKNGEWDYSNSSVKKSHRILTDDIVINHIRMDETIGIFSVKDATKFIAFDIDEHENSERIAMRIKREITSLGIAENYVHYCKSGNKGIHVYLFLDSLCWQTDAQKFYKYILSKCNLLDSKIDYRPTDGLGIKLPLSRNKKNPIYDDSICWFLDNDLKIVKYDYFLNIKSFPTNYFKQIVSELKIEREIIKADSNKSSDFYYKISNSYTYKQAIELEKHGLISKGTRNESCLIVAKVYNTQSYDKSEALEKLNEWMYNQNSINYTTKEKDWLKENKRIVNWIYKNDVKFDLKKNILNKIVYSKSELVEITKFKDLSTKKLAFGLCTHSHRFGDNDFYFTGSSIHDKCGIKSRSTISKSLKEIIVSNLLSITNLTKNGKQSIDKDEFTGEFIFSKNMYNFNHIEGECSNGYIYDEDYIALMINVYKNEFITKELRSMFGRYQYNSLFGSE